MNVLRISMSLALCVAGCSSSSSTPGPGDAGAEGADDGASEAGIGDGGDGATGDGAVDLGGGSLTGTYGTQPIAPIVAAYWIGKPSNPAESGGGPFIYLFSTAVTCADLSKGSGWSARLPAATQVLELIVGTTTVGTTVTAAAHAGPNVAEINYSFGQTTTEYRATSGNVTLTAYVAGTNVDGTVDATFPAGTAQGTFHAVYCASGNEY
ncbi:MAG TPA: hypothetical protein VIF15_19515 [Polyangiaceae bacterium]|jgi:hypothetical protein